ncbi:stAR-related lipid transfer 13 isoform X2, partial [Brachionus plicatilis]
IRPEERKTTLQQVMLLIPDENRLVLQTLLLFLNDIAKHQKVNQMSRNNLAVIFSPVIFSMNFDRKKKHKNLKNISTLPVNLNLISNETMKTVNIGLPTENIEENQASSNKPIFDLKDLNDETNQEESELRLKRNSNFELGSKLSEIQTPQPQSRLLSVPNANLNAVNASSKTPDQLNLDINSNLVQMIAQNSKRKYSNRLNKAASTLVNFGAELSTNKTTGFFFDSVKDTLETLEYMNKVVQLCVSDMIKYSMDLFTVPVENFEKLKLSVSFGSEPHNLEYFYDKEAKSIKRAEFFSNNIKIDKTNWFYFDKFEDVSIYYFKNDILFQSLLKNVESSTSNSGIQLPVSPNRTVTTAVTIQINDSTSNFLEPETFESVQSSFAIPQQNESFNDKLKLWKCCTLIKSQNLTFEKILTKIKDERKLWDDDFRDGKIVEKLDDQTELYRYVISFMPPHPSRDFFEIRHFTNPEGENPTLILTSTSVKHQAGNKLVGDIRSNLIISKYVIEKLISIDTMTTFKITHYIKMDYKGFTMEFYNKTFGYMMARLLYNLKMSLLNSH